MENCARLSNYLQREIVRVAEVANTVLLKDMQATWLRVIENGQVQQKLLRERSLVHDSSSSISMDVARL